MGRPGAGGAERAGRHRLVRRPIDERGLKLTPLYAERRLAALRADHPLATRESLTVAELAGEHHLRYLEPIKTGPARTTVLRSVEEKLEYVAAGHGIIVLPLSATLYYTRPDIVYVPVSDAEPDEVLLASEARSTVEVDHRVRRRGARRSSLTRPPKVRLTRHELTGLLLAKEGWAPWGENLIGRTM